MIPGNPDPRHREPRQRRARLNTSAWRQRQQARPGHAAAPSSPATPGPACENRRADPTLEFARTPGNRRVAEDQHVLVHDQVPGLTLSPCPAEVVELEERRPGDEPAAAQPGEQGDAAGGRDQARAGAGGDDGGGQVDQLAVVAPGPGGDHRQPAGAQQHGAAGQDRGEPGEQFVQPLVGEVGPVVAVAVVVLVHPAALAAALLGLDLPVDGRAVGRRGDHQGGPPGHAGGRSAGSWRASPRITSAVPAAPWRRAWATLAAASVAQRSSYSMPRPSRPRWTGIDRDSGRQERGPRPAGTHPARPVSGYAALGVGYG